MNTNDITNITDDLNSRCSLSYAEGEVNLRFESEELFADWFKNVAKSIKIGCTAKLLKYIMTDESIRVSYQWQHIVYDPANIQEMIKARLPVEVREWITKHVDRDLDWKQIKDLLRLDESRLDQNNTRFGTMPAALFVKYKDVKNLIDARIAYLTRNHSNDKESIKLWVDTLKQEGFFSLIRFHENGPFLLSWVSFWQKKVSPKAEEWCIDSTHKTCKSLNNPAENSYLFTAVVGSPITSKSVPVCFFITDHEVLSTSEQWLTSLKSTFTLKLKKIIIDCSLTEVGAIRSVFGDAVQVLLCHWYIKRAWETHIKKDIEVNKATEQSENVRSAVRTSLNSMMYAKSCEEFDLSVSLFNLKYKENISFVDYFNKLWVPKKQRWSQAWPHIESYHNQIKSFYLGRSRNLGVDHKLYLLTKGIVDYRQDSIRTYYGFHDAKLAAFEEEKRAKAYEINFDIACSMMEKIAEDVSIVVSGISC
ncbi:hypothetical protein G6F53_011179 [Rhizopus delemar]|nr:hypothetical protein G6F53_011179 [Rhizopus delemar]KAG1515563.1 hypothetical protein G6F52_009649 [Rhizopus delemar]